MSGDHLNFFLFQGPRSVWRGISSMAKALGAADHELPNVTEIAQYVAWTVAMGQFGYVRFPPGHGATPSPEEALRHFWPQWAPDLRLFAPSPDKQPELMTIAVRTAMNQAKEVLHPCDALAIVMESAIAMSRVDLPQEYWGYSEDSQSQPRAFSE
jgi:hypothetical protein